MSAPCTTSNGVPIFNPRDHGIEGQPLMVPAHVYNEALAALRKKGEWQPMETCPLDGTKVLMLHQNEGCWKNDRIQIGFIHPNVSVSGGVFMFDLKPEEKPIAWQPLPEIP